jgi:hypothetical protein
MKTVLELLSQGLGLLCAWLVVLAFFHAINYVTKNLFNYDIFKNLNKDNDNKD